MQALKVTQKGRAMIDNMNGKSKNKIRNTMVVTDQHELIEVTIKKGNEIIYRNKGYAGVVNIVQENIKWDSKDMTFEGDTQAFGFGHPLVQIFAFDQLRKKLKPSFVLGAQIFKKVIGHPKSEEYFNGVAEKNQKPKK